jgi:tetratricopeptide (TPR) repeat protein
MGGRRATAEATVAVAVVGSLLAILIHSIVDTQFHIPGVVALVFLLAARLDRPGEAVPGRIVPRRSLAAAGIVMLLVGVVILAPVDGAMVLAAQANAALNAGDAPSALGLFRTAVGLHELAPYRLGEGVAASYAGDPAEAQASFERAAALYPATFVRANLAATAEATARDAILSEIEAEDPYDPAAMANAAVLRYPSDVPQAIDDLADAMTGVPTLVYSKRPPELFDDETWAAAQAMAVDRIGAGDPVTAAAVAAIAGFKDLAARQSANVRDPRAREALDLLATAVQGGADGVERGRVLLREDPGSQVLERALWLIAFQAKSQVLVDEVATASLTLYFTVPDPPMELVLDGQLDADWAWRMPRWPMASDFRNGPDRQYAAGMVTIEPVYRPKDDPVAAAAALGVSVPTAR